MSERQENLVEALRIDPDGTVVVLAWPQDDAERRQVVRAAVGGGADTAVYHRRAHLHVHGNWQAENLPVNLSAWALASVWRGIDIPYGLYGPVVVTGPQLTELDEDLAEAVRAVCAAVVEIRQEWKVRPSVGEEQARAELLAGARHSVAALA
ncbi:hypothetical protein ACE1OC_42955 (plasmid) [Streptomyces sp. DSM 116496]|uniref:hypothetical protein n=1 Tax=Streptomyces stoeckheimensis TaxID=3344656 RepID=UPI0038B2461A